MLSAGLTFYQKVMKKLSDPSPLVAQKVALKAPFANKWSTQIPPTSKNYFFQSLTINFLPFCLTVNFCLGLQPRALIISMGKVIPKLFPATLVKLLTFLFFLVDIKSVYYVIDYVTSYLTDTNYKDML